jgi:hypothetical protein
VCEIFFLKKKVFSFIKWATFDFELGMHTFSILLFSKKKKKKRSCREAAFWSACFGGDNDVPVTKKKKGPQLSFCKLCKWMCGFIIS